MTVRQLVWFLILVVCYLFLDVILSDLLRVLGCLLWLGLSTQVLARSKRVES